MIGKSHSHLVIRAHAVIEMQSALGTRPGAIAVFLCRARSTILREILRPSLLALMRHRHNSKKQPEKSKTKNGSIFALTLNDLRLDDGKLRIGPGPLRNAPKTGFLRNGQQSSQKYTLSGVSSL